MQGRGQARAWGRGWQRRKQRAGRCYGCGGSLARGGAHAAHPKHEVHSRDAGRVPARDVSVELLQVVEETIHVCDGRDVPARDGAVLVSGGSRVGVVLLGRRLQGALVGKGVGRARVCEEPVRALLSWNGGLTERAARGASWAWGVVVSARAAAQGGSQPRRQGAGTERTVNMSVVSVTLVMLKFSGWLNAAAFCRAPRGGRGKKGAACRDGAGGEGVCGGCGASSVQGGSQLRRVGCQGGHAWSARKTCIPCS